MKEASAGDNGTGGVLICAPCHATLRFYRRRVHWLGGEEIRSCRFERFHLVEGLTVPRHQFAAAVVGTISLCPQVIGRGSFGKVYLAKKKTMPKKVLLVSSPLLHTSLCISSLRRRASTSP